MYELSPDPAMHELSSSKPPILVFAFYPPDPYTCPHQGCSAGYGILPHTGGGDLRLS